jgi:PilZ domain
MAKTSRPETFAIDHTDRRAEVRIDLSMPGTFCLANKRDAEGNRRKFACRAVNVSETAIALITPIAGAIGERVIAYFEEFGELNGAIIRSFDGGFVIRIAANKKDRTKFQKRLLWLRDSKNLKVSDRRTHKRIIPLNPRSSLVLPDGSVVECFVIDMSASGVAVSADIVPNIGTPLAVGKVVGRVIRHLDEGFAVRFNELQNLDRLEQVIVYNWNQEGAAAAPLLSVNDQRMDR